MMFAYCAGADLHSLVNNNMMTQYSNKTLVKSICLGVQHRQLNKTFIDTFHISLLTPIGNFSPFCKRFEDKS